MKSVSHNFKDAVASLTNESDIPREVSYKRRYWDAATREYIWESNWTVIPLSEIEAISPVTEQLDTERLNEFKVSNITLTLWNEDNRWRSDNPFGIFGPDSGSQLYFYSDYWTKFRVRVGIKLLDGTYEYTTIFTGLATEYTYSSQNNVQVTVQGLQSLLIKANAENVSTLVTEELHAASNTVFTTTNPGVGIIEEVSVAGIKQTAGTNYEVSNLNEPSLGATVTFTTSKSNVRITYRYWKQNQTVEDLVGDLLTEAGIAGASQIVDPVLFPNSVTKTFVQDTQSDWISGTLNKIDTSNSPGDLKIDYTNTNFKQLLDDFSGSLSSWTITGNVTIDTGRMKLVGERTVGPGPSFPYVTSASRDSSGVVGVWQFDFQLTSTVDDYILFTFANSYSVELNPALSKIYFSAPGILTADRPSYSWTANTSSHTLRIDRSAIGHVNVYLDGTNIISYAGPTGASASFIRFTARYPGTVYIDNVYIPSTTLSSDHISQNLDAVSTPVSWGKIEPSYDGSSVTFYTRASTDAISWDSWVQVASNFQVMSALKRYLQVKSELSTPSSSESDPTVHSYSLSYKTSATYVTLANFTGQTVYAAIQSLGKFANYEWGFTADEDFFFRSKTVTKTSDIDLAQNNYVREINGMVTGQDRVYSEVRATYGSFTSTVKAPGNIERDPLSKYGDKILEIDGGGILIDNDADVATGVAGLFAADLSKPKRRFKASCKLVPYIDLSDVVLVSFNQNQSRRTWFLGDESVALGDQSINLYGPTEQIVSEMYAKVIGARHDPDNFSSEFDLQEVL